MKINKKKIIIITIFIILIVVLILCFKLLNYYKTADERYETEIVEGTYTQQDIEIVKQSIDNYVEDKVIPKGISRLYGKYKGENEMSDLYRGFKRVTDYIPVISLELKDSTDTEIKDYFNINSDDIIKNIGISNVDEFIKFAKYILTFDSLQVLGLSEILTDTIESDEDYLTFNIKFVYDESKEVIIKTYFEKVDDKKDELFKFSVID